MDSPDLQLPHQEVPEASWGLSYEMPHFLDTEFLGGLLHDAHGTDWKNLLPPLHSGLQKKEMHISFGVCEKIW